MRNSCNISETTVNKYYGAILTNSKDLKNELNQYIEIYNINDISELDKIIDLYKSTKALVEKNKKGNNMYTAAFAKYREYLKFKKDNNQIIISDKYKAYEKVKINEIEIYLNSNGFIYSKESLSNFYLSLKTKPFVILAGISGTGKSKLVILFSEAIGCKDNYKLISVKPDWNDSTELIGYKNIKDDFIAGELIKIIKTASEPANKNKPYFICLDEMNLVRIEYYLSEYLSIIESREKNEDGQIVTNSIISDNYLPAGNEYKGLGIPENLYIIGTVNMDNTTFSFSRKVLDRANTIEFSDVYLESLDFNNGTVQNISVDNDFLKTRFLNIQEAVNYDRTFVEKINKKIIEINNILKPYSKHFGYRVRDEIVFYMLENNIAQLLDEDIAFDYQIMQKILPTIIGSDEGIKEILIKLFNYCLDGIQIDIDGDYVEEAKDNIKILNIE